MDVREATPAWSPTTLVTRFVGGEEPVTDNADPKKAGWAADPDGVITLDAVEVNTLNENLLGYAQLGHSRHCQASWGWFEPTERLGFLQSEAVTVTIVAHRPATGTVGTAYTAEFDGQAVFGNILLNNAGCIEISVIVRSPDGDGSATTACRR